MSSLVQKTVKFNFHGQPLSAEVKYHVDVEHDYGADADGHRGCRKIWIEDLSVSSVVDEQDNEVPVTTEVIEAIEEKIELGESE